MWTQLHALPWYTQAMLVLVGLMLVGAAWLLLKGAVGTAQFLVSSAWHSLRLTMEALLQRWAPTLISHGSAHWATGKELEAAGVWRTDGLALASLDGRVLTEPSGGHVTVIAPPRSGKSRGLITPFLRTYPGSVVVNDPRCELYAASREAREALGPTEVFAPGEETSCGINVFDMVRPAQAYGDVHRIMHALVAPRPDGPFDSAAVTVLTAVGLHLLATDQGSLPGVLEWLTGRRPLTEKVADLCASPTPHVASGGQVLRDQTANMRLGIWSRACDAVSVFQDDLVAAHTRHSDRDIRALHDGMQPVSLFLGVAFSDVDRLSPLLGIVTDAIIGVLSQPRSTPPRQHVTLVLDETANLGRLDRLESSVSYLQGCGVRVVAVFQNLGQLYRVYGPDSPLLSSMAALVAYAPAAGDMLTARYLSDLTGVTTVWAPALTQGAGVQEQGLWRGRTTSASAGLTSTATARALLTPDEVRGIGKEAALVFLSDVAPVLGSKLGTPALSVTQKTLRAVVQHPARVLLPVAAVLATLALRPAVPLLQPHATTAFSTPAPAVLASVAPTAAAQPAPVLAAGVAPTLPVVTAAVLPPTTQPVEPSVQPPPPTGQAPAPQPTWTLKSMTTDGHRPPEHRRRGHYGTQDECMIVLEQTFGPGLNVLEASTGNRAIQVQVDKTPERWRWQEKVFGRVKLSEAWCEKQEGAQP